MSERTTALTIASHRRYVLASVVTALRSVFSDTYDRDRQLVDLKVTTKYPLAAIEYPCIVVEYNNQTVQNAGVGHEEWFPDEHGILRKWHHSRFEGTIDFEIMALTSIDRDILADALTEVVRFGRLDQYLLPFFSTMYGNPNDPVALIFNQIMFNADEITSSGNSASLATWSPEDLMQYTTSLTSEVHGGYYNVRPQDAWGYVTRVITLPYLQGDQTVVLDLEAGWSNPFLYVDASTAKGKGMPGAITAQPFSGQAQPEFNAAFGFATDPNTLTYTASGSEGDTTPGPLVAGDALFMFLVTQAVDTDPAPPWESSLSGWTRDLSRQFHNATTGNNFDVGLWHYIWQVSDNASTYQAIFDIYPDSVGGTAAWLMYVVNGAGGSASFQGANWTGSYTGTPTNTTSIPMGEGSTADYTEVSNACGAYHADALGCYYNVAAGAVQVFAALTFGLDNNSGFGVTPRVGQAVDNFGGANSVSVQTGCANTYTMQMWDYIVAP